MIAEKLEHSVNTLRLLLEGNAENLHHFAPAVLQDMEADVERVRGLEDNAVIIHNSPYHPLHKFQEATNERA